MEKGERLCLLQQPAVSPFVVRSEFERWLPATCAECDWDCRPQTMECPHYRSKQEVDAGPETAAAETAAPTTPPPTSSSSTCTMVVHDGGGDLTHTPSSAALLSRVKDAVSRYHSWRENGVFSPSSSTMAPPMMRRLAAECSHHSQEPEAEVGEGGKLSSATNNNRGIGGDGGATRTAQAVPHPQRGPEPQRRAVGRTNASATEREAHMSEEREKGEGTPSTEVESVEISGATNFLGSALALFPLHGPPKQPNLPSPPSPPQTPAIDTAAIRSRHHYHQHKGEDTREKGGLTESTSTAVTPRSAIPRR